MPYRTSDEKRPHIVIVYRNSPTLILITLLAVLSSFMTVLGFYMKSLTTSPSTTTVLTIEVSSAAPPFELTIPADTATNRTQVQLDTFPVVPAYTRNPAMPPNYDPSRRCFNRFDPSLDVLFNAMDAGIYSSDALGSSGFR